MYLLKHKKLMEKLQSEVRGAAQNAHDETFASTLVLKYTEMVIGERLRMYPPVPTILYRITQPQGDYICGDYIPGN
jgi:cytochrome P450